MSAPELITLQETYCALWQRMQIKPDRNQGIRNDALRCIQGKQRYQAVADALGLPKATGWTFISVLHLREANLNFHSHLHNGDPLTRRTTHVPAGRPVNGNPPFTWEESAQDALTMRGIHQLAEQLTTVAGFAYGCEGYNGWGYFWKDKVSPYLWGGTDVQDPGKYVEDGKFDPTVMDTQPGVMAVLKCIMALDPTVVFQSLSQSKTQGSSVVRSPGGAATHVAPRQTPTSGLPTAPAQRGWLHTAAVAISTMLGAGSSVAQLFQVLRPYLENPVVIGAIVAALVACGFLIWREHRVRTSP